MTAFVSLKSQILIMKKNVVNKHQDVIDLWSDYICIQQWFCPSEHIKTGRKNELNLSRGRERTHVQVDIKSLGAHLLIYWLGNTNTLLSLLSYFVSMCSQWVPLVCHSWERWSRKEERRDFWEWGSFFFSSKPFSATPWRPIWTRVGWVRPYLCLE